MSKSALCPFPSPAWQKVGTTNLKAWQGILMERPLPHPRGTGILRVRLCWPQDPGLNCSHPLG